MQRVKGKTDVRENGKTAAEARLEGGRARALPGDRRRAIVRNLATAPWPYSFADAETFLMRERAPHDAACLIFLRTDGAPRLVGGIGFGRKPGDGEPEFGYWIARPYWGRGYRHRGRAGRCSPMPATRCG